MIVSWKALLLPLPLTVLQLVLSDQCLPCGTQCVNIVDQHPNNKKHKLVCSLFQSSFYSVITWYR